MADEARAMLDALMGADRNTHIPSNEGESVSRNKRRRSCYDPDVCPLYCAWGVDLFDLFKNTKSDLGAVNDYIVDDDAREEFMSLPEHEKERLGYEFMLYRKLSDLVRGCNRIVDRNKEKLKAEIAKNARQRAEGKNEALVLDISQYVDSEQLVQCAENIAALELYEEQVETLSQELQSLKSKEQLLEAKLSNQNSNNNINNNENSDIHENGGKDDNLCLDTQDPLEIKKDLQSLVKEQQTILLQISQLISDHIHPLRDSTQNQKRQLYYVRSDTTSDKTVCEVSGNFMSSRDADERIAAHYAGKQYVGWKLVREKCQQLSQKYGKLNHNNNHPPRYGGGYGHGHRGGPPPPPPPYGGGYPPPSRNDYHHNHRSGRRDRDRSRSRDRDDGRHYHRRRSPSPARWERDRGPARGYDQHRGGGGHHRSHRKRSGGRDRRR